MSRAHRFRSPGLQNSKDSVDALNEVLGTFQHFQCLTSFCPEKFLNLQSGFKNVSHGVCAAAAAQRDLHFIPELLVHCVRWLGAADVPALPSYNSKKKKKTDKKQNGSLLCVSGYHLYTNATGFPECSVMSRAELVTREILPVRPCWPTGHLHSAGSLSHTAACEYFKRRTGRGCDRLF